jgi:hypothetical protein
MNALHDAIDMAMEDALADNPEFVADQIYYDIAHSVMLTWEPRSEVEDFCLAQGWGTPRP